MRQLRTLGIVSTAFSILLCSCFANPKPYVSDFVFPTEQGSTDQTTESADNNGQRGVWVTSDIKSQDKCPDFHLDDSHGYVRLIFISYNKVNDPLESLNKALIGELNLPELVNSLRVVNRGRRRLIFELPSAIDAFLTLNSYCKLYHDRHDLTYEIFNVEGC
uniref:Uncharacterized protein LOC108052127 n=1 Tax=Drosophila rhopaloa TaxID=1041015 RepID=A0A6P4FXM9_DRORH